MQQFSFELAEKKSKSRKKLLVVISLSNACRKYLDPDRISEVGWKRVAGHARRD